MKQETRTMLLGLRKLRSFITNKYNLGIREKAKGSSISFCWLGTEDKETSPLLPGKNNEVTLDISYPEATFNSIET